MVNKGFCGRSALFAAAGVALSLGLVACGSDSNNGNNPDGGTGGEGTGGKASGTGGKGSGGTTNNGGTTAGTGGAKGGAGGTTSNGGTGGTAGGGKGGSGGAEKPDGSIDGGGDGGDGCVPTESSTVPTVPDIIKLPADEMLLHHFHATGTQNYKCTSSGGATPTYSWVATPEAFLYDSCNNKVIQHSAGPTWTWLADGSAIKGTKLFGSDVAGSIQQLLLSAVSVGSNGVLSNVNYVQRLNTSGGVSPATGECTSANVDEVRKVAYEATYYFYVASPRDGGADADSGKK
jgi:hypothetical protein